MRDHGPVQALGALGADAGDELRQRLGARLRGAVAERGRALRRVVAEPLDRRDLVGVELRGLVLDLLGVPAREVVEVVVHARHDDGDVAGGREVAEDLGRAAVALRVEEQEVAVGVVELEQLGQARVGVVHAVGAQARDLALDRLGVGGVAQADRRAVEVADQLRVLVRERLGDVRVEVLEERGDRARVGPVGGDQALRGRVAARSSAWRSTAGPASRCRSRP